MTHPLVDQMRFTRAEWLRGLEGVSEENASRHFGPMNCISWNVGHLAWHEQRYWLERAQGRVPFPELNERFAYRAPMSTPLLSETRAQWRAVTQEVERFQDRFTAETLLLDLPNRGRSIGQSYGSALLRVLYHYWYHTGETQAIRQMLEEHGLPEYVGDLEKEAPYRSPET